VCARAGDIERNLKKKEKGTSGIKGEEKEREKSEEAKSSFVVHVCHTYVCTLKRKRERERERERRETR